VADLARLAELLVHAVDVAPEGHAVQRAAEQVHHEGESVALVAVDRPAERDAGARLVRDRSVGLAVGVDRHARIELMALDARVETLFQAICEVAMSRHTGLAAAARHAIEIGLVPKYFCLPPWGTTTELECVIAIPISRGPAAMRV
jgi:hypothetical protein